MQPNTKPSGKSKFERNPDGAFIINGQEVGHTLQCVHCGMHFLSVRGSGKVRGWCTLCKGITCGKPECDAHIPHEGKLEFSEAVAANNLKVIKKLLNRYPDLRDLMTL